MPTYLIRILLVLSLAILLPGCGGGGNSKQFTSTRIKTQGLVQFQYGRIEARIKRPKATGFWPAFWMLGTNITAVGWPRCGEIDIMEQRNVEDVNYATAHFANASGAYTNSGTGSTVLSPGADTYHLYTIEWTPNAINWSVDGVGYKMLTIAAGVGSTEEFVGRNFFIIINFAIAGNFTGNMVPVSTSVPANMHVDFVRVFNYVGPGFSVTPDWIDEFNGPVGSKPNPLYWTYDTGNNGWGNNEVQNYTAGNNVGVVADVDALDGSALQIQVRYE